MSAQPSMVIGTVLRASLLCLLATLVWAGNANPPSPSSSYSAPSPAPAVRSNVSCEDTEGKKEGCTDFCPIDCPQDCLVFCPGCKTFCRPDQVQVRPAKRPVRPYAIFMFGDAVLDIGNSNELASGRYDEPHDDQQILQSQWVGNDGDNIAQFIAKFMGFHDSPPAYLTTLSTPIHAGKGFTGMNYACAGAGLRDPDNNTDGWLTIPMSKQLKFFEATIAQMKEAKLDVQAVLAKSFFLIGVGGADLTHYGPYPYRPTEVQELLDLYGDKIKDLYNMGARIFGLINVGLIGNTPNLAWGFDPADMNKHATEFNDGLKPLLARLGESLPGFRYSIADMYAYTEAVFADPKTYGFEEDIQNVCSPDGSFGPPSENQPPCDNPAQYWYWNSNGGITDHAANLSAAAFFYGPPQYTVTVIFRALLDQK